jgi:hypothetical protein
VICSDGAGVAGFCKKADAYKITLRSCRRLRIVCKAARSLRFNQAAR